MDISEGRELLTQARPGPWKHDHGEIRDAAGDLVLYGGACGDGFASVPDASLIVWARNNLSDLFDELEKTQRGARTLGEIIHRTGLEMLDATDAHHFINDDGDGDWQLVSEFLAELRPARDAAIARAEEAEAAIDRVREAACFHLGGDAEQVILRALEGEDTDIWGAWGSD